MISNNSAPGRTNTAQWHLGGAGHAFRHAPQLPKTSTGKIHKFKLRDMPKEARGPLCQLHIERKVCLTTDVDYSSHPCYKPSHPRSCGASPETP
jgi:hypothetical protein